MNESKIMIKKKRESSDLLIILIVILILLFILIFMLINKALEDRAWQKLIEKQCPKNVTVGEGQAMYCPPLAEVEAGYQGCVYNISEKTEEQIRNGQVC